MEVSDWPRALALTHLLLFICTNSHFTTSCCCFLICCCSITCSLEILLVLKFILFFIYLLFLFLLLNLCWKSTHITMCAFIASVLRRLILCLLATTLLLLYTPPEKNLEENLVHQVQVRLATTGRCYLGPLAGEQTVLWLQETLSPLLDTGMNATLQQVSLCFKAAGFKDDPVVDTVTPQDLVLVLQGILLAVALSWPLSVAYRLIMPFLRPVLKMVKGFISTMAFILGFKRFPFSVGKLKLKFNLKKKKTGEKEEQGKSQGGGCEKKESKEKKSSGFRLFRRDKNKSTE